MAQRPNLEAAALLRCSSQANSRERNNETHAELLPEKRRSGSASMPTSAVAEPSVTALRAEADVTRTRLTGTVEELRTQVADTATDLKERLSPSAIKAEVSDYVRGSRDQLWHCLLYTSDAADER